MRRSFRLFGGSKANGPSQSYMPFSCTATVASDPQSISLAPWPVSPGATAATADAHDQHRSSTASSQTYPYIIYENLLYIILQRSLETDDSVMRNRTHAIIYRKMQAAKCRITACRSELFLAPVQHSCWEAAGHFK